ncbi:Type IV fimbrial assembly, ATPase PilB [Marinobacter excellens LAMA 842]|jgi:type IV pilus assembly protein PilB|uniref:Type IV fimbrial assembly, ATPase PilB n=2 Tax=Marinobacter TaxID=2742 RepID=A0A137S900_9GAMM|nr:Type IV fimbrial assembly, ATPase PilB [Marinobacter excellens LAMA 842]
MGVKERMTLLDALSELKYVESNFDFDVGEFEASSDFEAALVERGVVTKSQLSKALAFQLGVRELELRSAGLTHQVFDILPFEICNRFQVVPVSDTDGVVEVAFSDPRDLKLQHLLEFYTQKRVRFCVADSDSIRQTLATLNEKHDALKDVTDGMRLEIVLDDGKENKSYSLEEFGELSSSPVVRLINTTIISALKKRVSDIHFEVYEYGIEVKYRIDGILYPATEMLDSSYHASLISRLKVMAELDIAEKRIPQDGRFKLKVQGREIDFRLSVIPTTYGENAVVRVLDNLSGAQSASELKLDNLGIQPEQLKYVRRAVNEPYGMILIAGPTGSGKTTTIYSALTEINSGREKIITIEDPVEYQIDGVMQIAVNEKKGLTFSSGLRSVLRHDPDKILVGEIRDAETASIAVRSALTGHLVFSTVHANNAIDVISRFQNMGIDIFNFISSLNCVVAQRLLRVLCPSCKAQTHYDSTYLIEMGFTPEETDVPFFTASGCEECGGTGYRGRTSIAEVLVLNDDLRHRILERQSVYEALNAKDLCGALTLRRSALNAAKIGLSSLEEVNRVTFVE